MKKLIIASGVFLATASISLNAEIYTKQLNNTGWHSIGVPIDDITIGSTMFPASVNYVWKWNSVSQSWEFYSNNQTLIDSAKSTGIKILSKLEKGDSIWVKTTSSSDSIKFENNITTEYLSQDPSDYDTSIFKIGSSGQILADDETLYKAIYMKETGLWAEHKTPVTGNQVFTWSEAVSYCKDLNLAGKSDWYLPSSSEISSINSIVKVENSFIDNMNLLENERYFVSDSSQGVYEFYNNTYSFYSGKYAICFRDANKVEENTSLFVENTNNFEVLKNGTYDKYGTTYYYLSLDKESNIDFTENYGYTTLTIYDNDMNPLHTITSSQTKKLSAGSYIVKIYNEYNSDSITIFSLGLSN